MKAGGCYAVGDVLSSKKVTGQLLGVGLIGKIVEHPIVADYLKETHNITGPAATVSAMALLLDQDWWDVSVSKTPYLTTLVRWHPELPASTIHAMNPTRPDVLTRNGPRFTAAGILAGQDRNEYYEIKSDSDTGEKDGDDDLKKIKDFFKDLRKTHGLKTNYVPGEAYPKHPSKEKRIALPLTREFVNLAAVFLRRHGILKMEAYIAVRRSKPGLLQYKLCFEIETDDRRKQQALAKAAAKHLAAAYVVTNYPEQFAAVEKELGDYQYEGDKFPRIRCAFDVIPELSPLTKSIEEAIFMRGIAYPGDELLLFCDESYYWELLATRPYGTAYVWQQALAVVKSWVNYAPGSPGWAIIQPWVAKAEAIGAEIKTKYPYHVDFADAVIEYGRKNPYELIAIVALPIIITAGVVIALETGLLGGILLAEGALAETSATAVGGLGRVAMSESVATQVIGTQVARGAGARGLMSVGEVAKQIGGLGASANDVAAIGRVVAGPALRTAVKGAAGMGAAAAFLLGINVRTAYAQPSSGAAPGGEQKPQTASIDPKSKVVAETSSRMLAVTPLAAPRNTTVPLMKGKSFNVHNYAPTSPLDGKLAQGVAPTLEDFSPPPPANMRYLGRVKIS